MAGYVDPEGNPISLQAWAQLNGDLSNQILASDTIGGDTFETLWTGIVIEELGVAPYATIVRRGGQFVREVRQYPDLQDALDGHRRIVEHDHRGEHHDVWVGWPLDDDIARGRREVVRLSLRAEGYCRASAVGWPEPNDRGEQP